MFNVIKYRMKFFTSILLVLAAQICAAETPREVLDKQSGIVSRQDIFQPGEFFESCHASTVLETLDGGLLVAYFAGTREGADDVCIWISKFKDGKWSNPRIAASATMTQEKPAPCWNPVLFRNSDNSITLFFKQSGNWHNWRGMQTISKDEGQTWSTPEPLAPKGNFGPIKNKPARVGKRIILPASDEFSADDWRVYFWLSDDDGKTWTRTPYVNQKDEIGGIQPSILIHKNGDLQAIGRTPRDIGFVYQTWSRDGGKTWSKLASTGLPNPNSGTDAVTLQDGRHLLVYNHTQNWKIRSPLNVAISSDGMRWQPALVLEDATGEFSYPAVVQRKDGLVDITYTNRRKTITHVVVDPAKLSPSTAEMFAQWDVPAKTFESQSERAAREDAAAKALKAKKRGLKNARERRLRN